MPDDTDKRRLVAVTLDEASIGRGSPDQEHERAIAIYDILEANSFAVPGRSGPFALNFDLIVSLAPEAHHAALELTRTLAADVEYWPTADPSIVQGSREQKLDAYRDVRDGLSHRIRTRLKE